MLIFTPVHSEIFHLEAMFMTSKPQAH